MSTQWYMMIERYLPKGEMKVLGHLKTHPHTSVETVGTVCDRRRNRKVQLHSIKRSAIIFYTQLPKVLGLQISDGNIEKRKY